LEWEAQIHRFISLLADLQLINSACDISDGGLAVALSEASFANNVGALVDIIGDPDTGVPFGLFLEDASTLLITCSPEAERKIVELASDEDIEVFHIGKTIPNRIEITVEGGIVVDASIEELKAAWSGALDSLLTEVHA
jgi:phosphoribosylformylglycinamidine synthase